jgi:hypothetical protein
MLDRKRLNLGKHLQAERKPLRINTGRHELPVHDGDCTWRGSFPEN